MKSNSNKNSSGKIFVEKEENFNLLGIISPKPIYKLAFLLNKALETEFKLFNSRHIEYSLPNLPTIYFNNETKGWYLLNNVFTIKNTKLKDYDYFLIAYPKISDTLLEHYLSRINRIEDIVITAIIEHRKEIINLFSAIV